ncbi:DUF6456 domain-containing protein [Pseudorhodoplanes sinuspersici]|uniref:Uncharacterized protein n=1 Tax=Pseudorhodoplanes sinuspersici TaxID=1235591 RepID=A0A1W6ZLM8_9HYPH|nr:DUF6456 domain-containing protein [Pseudorhodoplanes sinuspersici]ARP98175.1 hypothetical protein CAK95_03060 [Pseudorhodoplanes sinuspersici]RKE68070.1 hypothetical protein DFP91_4426 [Pseudorhodoplanes sinuspersici]
MTKKQKQKLSGSKPGTEAGQRVTRVVTEFDPNGIEVMHHRTVDTLALMLRSGAITPAMHAAGRDFQAAFTFACFDSMPRVNLNLMGRSPSPAHDVYSLSDRQLAARERVARAIDALGGHGSPAGSCVWHVVGMQTSVREWALRQGWGGRPVRQESAQGILVAALGVLAKHFGIRESGVRRCA